MREDLNVMVMDKNTSPKETAKVDNSEAVLKRIHDANFVCLRDEKGYCLNVAYTEDGLTWTTDNLGKKLWGKKGTYVELFKPTKESIKSRSMFAKFEKRWMNKANAMLYNQR